MNFAPSATQIIRNAQAAIERHAQVRQAPAVLWAGLNELPQAFAARCDQVRAKRSGRRILAAVPHGYLVL
jgi:hypothetical protein